LSGSAALRVALPVSVADMDYDDMFCIFSCEEVAISEERATMDIRQQVLMVPACFLRNIIVKYDVPLIETRIVSGLVGSDLIHRRWRRVPMLGPRQPKQLSRRLWRLQKRTGLKM
jgi:hypothetical protein